MVRCSQADLNNAAVNKAKMVSDRSEDGVNKKKNVKLFIEITNDLPENV